MELSTLEIVPHIISKFHWRCNLLHQNLKLIEYSRRSARGPRLLINHQLISWLIENLISQVSYSSETTSTYYSDWFDLHPEISTISRPKQIVSTGITIAYDS